MTKKKQSRLDILEKKQQALINVVSALTKENEFLKDLAVGTFETLKQMDGYENALNKLIESQKENEVVQSDKKLEL